MCEQKACPEMIVGLQVKLPDDEVPAIPTIELLKRVKDGLRFLGTMVRLSSNVSCAKCLR